MVDYVAIGRRVKKYRLQAKLTQSDLAEKLDVSVGFVSQIERGSTEVSLKRLESIANTMNTKLEYLISDSVPETNIEGKSIQELTKNWNKEQTNILINIITNLDGYFRS